MAQSTGTARFFALAFGITWLAMIPVVLAFRGLAAVPAAVVDLAAVIGSSGPSIAAVILVLASGAGLRALAAPPSSSSCGRRLVIIAVALVFPFALHIVGAAVAYAGGAPATVFALGTPSTAEHVGILIIAPLGEELGWRGYAQRRLETAQGALRASLVIGVMWAAWHAPMILARPPELIDIVTSVVLVIAGSVIFATLFRLSGGSLLVAIAAHAGAHLDNTSRLGGPPLYASCAAFVVVAAACAWFLSVDERRRR